jgi:hypothetical protein
MVGGPAPRRSWVKWSSIGAALLALVALLVVWGNRPSREGQPGERGERGTVSMPELQTGPAQDEKFLDSLEQEGVEFTSRIQAQDAAIAYCTSMIDGNGFVDSMQRIMDLDPNLTPDEAVTISKAAEQAYCPSAALAGAPR